MLNITPLKHIVNTFITNLLRTILNYVGADIIRPKINTIPVGAIISARDLHHYVGADIIRLLRQHFAFASIIDSHIFYILYF